MRPGISNGMLERAGVRHVSAEEAKDLCGLDSSGLWLPYRNLDGSAICDGGKDYGRLRLDKPRGDMKYYQAGGTNVHAYLPPTLADATDVGGDLFIIEGEFKSLSQTEAGFPDFSASRRRTMPGWCRSWRRSSSAASRRAFCSVVIRTRR